MRRIKQNRSDRAYIFFVEFALFFVAIAILAGRAFG